MGKQGADAKSEGRKMSLEDLPKVLGEQMPKLEFNPVGRLRLQNALKQRYGANYRNLPGVSDILNHFDSEAKANLVFHQLKIKLGGG